VTLTLTENISLLDVMPIVDAVVAQMSRHLPAHVSAQDLASAGKLAVMEVLGDFNNDLSQDRGYVVCRVRGAVLDEMRRLDPLSRYGRARVKGLQKALAYLESTLNRAPTDAEIADEMGVPEDEVRKIENLAASAERLSTDAIEVSGGSLRSIVDADAVSPAESAEESESAALIRAAIQRLTPGQSSVLQRYYFGGLTLQEIAAEMGLSVVRVHQLRVAAEEKLRGDIALIDAMVEIQA